MSDPKRNYNEKRMLCRKTRRKRVTGQCLVSSESQSSGRRKELTHRASREKEAAVIVGKAHTEVALDFRYLSFACGHLNNLAGLPMI